MGRNLTALISSQGKLRIKEPRTTVKVLSYFRPFFVNQDNFDRELRKKMPEKANAYLVGEEMQVKGRDDQAFPFKNTYFAVQPYTIQKGA